MKLENQNKMSGFNNLSTNKTEAVSTALKAQ